MVFRATIDKLYFYFSPKKQNQTTYIYSIGAAICLIALIAAGVGGWRWYRFNQGQKAQETFSSCIREYERAEQDPTLWPNAELVFRLAIEQHPHTTLTPSLLAFQAEALLHMNKPEQALTCMKEAVTLLPQSSILYTLYATKYALMMMDAPEIPMQQEGLNSLTQLAQDTTNNNRDMALYFLGLYYWADDNTEKARTIWSELLPLATAQPASPWAQRAAEKIEYMGV
jgi:tetratricopeptide (TPR) repeat protein